MTKIKLFLASLFVALFAVVGVAAPATAAPAHAASTPVLYLQGDPGLPLSDIAADWSKRTGVTVVVADCTGQPECITVNVLPEGVDPCGNWQYNGCAQDDQATQTCRVTVDHYIAGDPLSLLYVMKHEVGHCIWALGPATPWYGHLSNPNAIMYNQMTGYPQQYNDTVLTKYDRDWSRYLFGL